MRFIKLFFLQIFLMLTLGLSAQGLSAQAETENGIIRGSIVDSLSGSPLFGARIFLLNTETGAVTDLEGKFNLSVAPGIYDLRVSYVSYATIIISELVVEKGKVVLLENVQMKSAITEFEVVNITVFKVVANNENSFLKLKQGSVNLIDGISSGAFRSIGDSDAASAMTRVSGVSVTGGKYVFVRGLGDRYNKTILNGVDIPGLDPDRNTLQMDIFPTNLIDNIVVHKSFIAELPADFSGGVIDINLKSFPESRRRSVFVSAGYNPSFHFNNDYLTYDGGKTDFLGFDDGTRDIPALSNIPFFSQAVGNPDGEAGLRYRHILESFNPTLAAYKQKSFMDYSFGTSLGNQFKYEKFSLGYNFVLSYKNNTEYYEDAQFSRYGLSGDANNTAMEVRELQVGDYGVNTVLITGLAGLAIKTQNSKYSLTILHLQNGESKAGIFDYSNADQGSEFIGFQHNLEYSQRTLTNFHLTGKHFFKEGGWEVEWKVAPTLSTIKDPDIRFTRYEDRDSLFTISTESGFPERIWREMEEKNLVGLMHFTKDYEFLKRKAKFKFGGSYTYKQREFIVRSFALNIRNIDLTGDPNELFAPENIWPYNGDVTTGTTYEANFAPTNPNQFNSNIRNIAGYLATEVSLAKKLKAVVGLRAEYYTQRYTGQDQLGTNVLSNQKVLDNVGIFPSLNLVYNLNEKQNLRFSYGKTIARPSFKELSYAEIYDPITGRTFIGGLFRDANDAAGIEYWDGNLRSTDIHNFDFRWEVFQSAGQTISISGFYKKFYNPIEIVQYSAQSGAFQPRNVGDGQIVGAEIELRQSLKPISASLTNFSFSLNVTVADSRIKLSDTEYQSRLANARTGQVIDEYRDMAGQAPFIINSGFSYKGGEKQKGFLKGFEAGVYYNVQGPTLEFVGIVDRPDIYTNSFHSLNFNTNKTFGKEDQMQFGIKVENILNDKKESVFKSFNTSDEYFTRLSPGVTCQMRFSYNF